MKDYTQKGSIILCEAELHFKLGARSMKPTIIRASELIEPSRVLPPRREFFNLFWNPLFERAKAKDLTDHEAEKAVEFVLETILLEGGMDADLTVESQLAQAVNRAVVAAELFRKSSHTRACVTDRKYSRLAIYHRLLHKLDWLLAVDAASEDLRAYRRQLSRPPWAAERLARVVRFANEGWPVGL